MKLSYAWLTVLLGILQSGSAVAGTGALNVITQSGNNPAGCPSSSADYSSRFNGNAPDKFNLAIRLYDGGKELVHTGANFGEATGLSIADSNKTVRNTRDQNYAETLDNYSAFQLDCGKYGSFINTKSYPQQVVFGGGPNTAYSMNFSSPPAIFNSTYNEFWLQIDNASMPQIYSWGGIGQLSLAVFIRYVDAGNQQSFQILNELYDSRSSYNYAPTAAWDAATQTAFATAPMNSNAYLTPGPAGFGFSPLQTGTTPWWNKSFRSQISRTNFVNIINDVNVLCRAYRGFPNCGSDFPVPNANNPDDPTWLKYKLSSMFVLHEVFYTGYGDIRMGVNAGGVGAYQYSRPGVN